MKKTLKLFALLICFSPFGARAALSPAPSKADALKYLSDLKKLNSDRLAETDKALTSKLDDTKQTLKLADLDSQIDHLRHDRAELSLRQDFLDRLTLEVDVHYDGKNIKEFLEKSLQSMAKIEAQSNHEPNIWKFLNYLSLALDKSTERQDQVLAFVEGYMKQSSIQNPIRPDEYLASTAYTNGTETEAAHPMNREKVGEYADRRIRELKLRGATTISGKTPVNPGL